MARHLARIALAVPCALAAAGAEPTKDAMSHWSFDAAALRPFWSSTTMHGESVMPLAGEPGKPVTVPLLLTPTKITAVTSSDGTRAYREGKDWQLVKDEAKLLIPAGSAIPLVDPARLVAKPGTQQFALTRRDGKGEVLFGAKLEWQDMQVVVSYTHAAAAWSDAPVFASRELPRTVGLLRAHAPLRIVLLGDSISFGWNASAVVGEAPFQPAYGELFAESLRRAYGATVTLTNLAVSGQTAQWGTTVTDQVVAAKPDLALIAFGMNDACGGCDAATFATRVAAIMDQTRKGAPNAEFILVAAMLGQAEWTLMQIDKFPAYRDALATLAKSRGAGVALCDATTLWAHLLESKRYEDLTGNGVNHPNDFGHRLYAQLLDALLIPAAR